MKHMRLNLISQPTFDQPWLTDNIFLEPFFKLSFFFFEELIIFKFTQEVHFITFIRSLLSVFILPYLMQSRQIIQTETANLDSCPLPRELINITLPYPYMLVFLRLLTWICVLLLSQLTLIFERHSINIHIGHLRISLAEIRLFNSLIHKSFLNFCQSLVGGLWKFAHF